MSVRLLIDSLIAVLLVGLLGIVLRHHDTVEADIQRDHAVQNALTSLYEQVLYHAAVEDVNRTSAGFPHTIPEAWREDHLPRNPLSASKHPCLDVAEPGDLSNHPPDPVIRQRHQAGFWYNPNRGVFRARVTPLFTDTETLALYNRVNCTNLKSLPPQKTIAPPIAPVRPATAAGPRKDAEPAGAAAPLPPQPRTAEKPLVPAPPRRPSLKDRRPQTAEPRRHAEGERL